MGLFFIKTFAENAEEKAVYGAAGSTIGPGAGVLTGILFMLLIFSVNRRRIKIRVARDTHPEESWNKILRVILFMLTPVIFSTCVYNVSSYVNQTLFAPIMMEKGYSGQEVAKMFNQYSGMYLVLTNVPIALANASSTALIPSIARSFALRKFRDVKSQINEAVRMTMVIAIPAAAGLSALAFPIMRILFGKNTQMAAWMMVFGGCAVIFYSLSTITNGVLQGIGQQTVPLKNAAISLLVNVAVLIIMTSVMPLGAFPVMLSNLAYGICMCVLNQKALRRHVRYQPEYQMTYVYPGLAAFAMGASAMVIYYVVNKIFHQTVIALAMAVPTAGILYFIYYVLISKIKEEELRNIYFGNKIVWLMKKIHIYK